MHDWEFPQKWYSFVAMVVTLAQHIIQALVITPAQWITLHLELATEACEARPVMTNFHKENGLVRPSLFGEYSRSVYYTGNPSNKGGSMATT